MNRVVSICPDPLLSHTDLTPAEARQKVAKAVARWVNTPAIRYVTPEEMALHHPPDCGSLPSNMAKWSKLVHVAIDPSRHCKVSVRSDEVDGIPLDTEDLVIAEAVDEDVIETLILEDLFGKYPARWPKI